MNSYLIQDLDFIFSKSNLFISKLEFNFLLSKYDNSHKKEEIFKIILEYLFNKSMEYIFINKSYKLFYTFVFNKYTNIFYYNIYEEKDTLYFQLFRKAFLNDLILMTFKGEIILGELLFDFIKKIDFSIIDKNGIFIFHIIKYNKKNGYKLLELILKNNISYPDLKNNIVFQEELFKIIYKIEIKDYLFLKRLFPWLEEKQKEYFEKETNTNKYLISLNNLIKNL